jgi:hypothetical protein
MRSTNGLRVLLNPDQANPKVEASFKDELAKTLRDGFTAAEVAEAKIRSPFPS